MNASNEVAVIKTSEGDMVVQFWNDAAPNTIENSDPDSAGSQFFICLASVPRLDHQYTTFGKLIKGDDVLGRIGDTPVTRSSSGENSKPIKRVVIESIKIVPANSAK